MKSVSTPTLKSSLITSLAIIAYSLLAACAPLQARSLPVRAQMLRASAASCQIQGLRGNPQDALAQLLRSQKTCPTDVFQFRQLLQGSGARLQTTMVANRGFHNASEGSFSLFETVTGPVRQVNFQLAPGQLFFGHFTEPDGQQLVNAQSPAQGNLMIELIAWDPGKRVYNFYELIGQGSAGAWFYRGDSLDIRADLSDLHRQADPARPRFGNRLRCSGCHLGGGPIMKELAGPHNDWWSARRRLPLGGRMPDARLGAMMQGLDDASLLADHVRQGMQQLQNGNPFAGAEDLQARLRPLFCPQEVNFESDSMPFEAANPGTELASAQLADPRLVPPAGLPAPAAHYVAALAALGSRFPEIERSDGDHAWLGPVKAFADQGEVEGLLRQGLIDQEFVLDVLAVDYRRPVVSSARCGLLPLLPKTAAPGWQRQFAANLAGSPLPAARQLLSHLQQPDGAQHQQKARAFVSACAMRLQSPEGVRELLGWVGLQRQAIAQSEISRNPRGQILEPGFRVIFPLMQLPAGELDDTCRLRS